MLLAARTSAMPAMLFGKAIRFGVFEVDPQSGELRKHGVRIRLQEQPFKILMALLERPGEVVGREELRERIWGNDTFVDFDHGLSAAVNRLREALGDSPENPRYIETLARRGYRFIGALERPPQEAVQVVEAAPICPQAGPLARVPSRRGVAWGAAACAAMAVAATAGLWLVGRQSVLPPMQVVPLTSLAGLELAPAFSPDGTQVAFSWTGEKQDNWDIYVKLLHSVTPLRLTSDPAADQSPAWSPDGNQIAFMRYRPAGSAVMLVSPLGGGERKLTDARAIGARPLAWTRDGKYLAIAERGPEENDSGITLLPLDGGERRRLTAHRGAGYDCSPAFSPDGRFLAFVSYSAVFSSDVKLLELGPNLTRRGEVRRLTRQEAWITGLAWVADGRSLVYSASRAPDAENYLWRVSISGSRRPERLEIAGPNSDYPATALKGNRLAFVKYDSDNDIWKWEAGFPAVEFLSSTRRDNNPAFSPDGTRIAFASSRAGRGNEIWVCNRDGSNPTQLTDGLGRFQGSPRWSPDGRILVFDSQGEDGHWDIYAIDAAGGTPRRLTADPSNEAMPSYSRDGRWVYFCSDRGSSENVWRIPSGGGEWTQMTRDGGCAAQESWDGKTLYYDTFGLGTGGLAPLFAKPLAGGPERRIVDAVRTRVFLPTPEGVYYAAPAEAGQTSRLMLYDFKMGKSRQVALLPARLHLGLTATPDRKTFLFSVFKPPRQDLMLIENFR